VLALSLSILSNSLLAQQPVIKPLPLEARQQVIVALSAFTTRGDLVKLETASHDGLGAGLTIKNQRSAGTPVCLLRLSKKPSRHQLIHGYFRKKKSKRRNR
jgi:hypothetical protein